MNRLRVVFSIFRVEKIKFLPGAVSGQVSVKQLEVGKKRA